MPHAVLTFHGTVTVLSKLLVCRNCCEHCCVWQILWSFLQVPPKVWRVLCHSCVDYMGEQKTCVAIFSEFPCDNTWTLFGIIHVINVSCGKNRIHKFPFFVAVGQAKPDPCLTCRGALKNLSTGKELGIFPNFFLSGMLLCQVGRTPRMPLTFLLA